MADSSNSELFSISAGILKKNACIVLVKTEWNAAIVDELEKGCREKLEVYKVKKVITKIGGYDTTLAIEDNAFTDKFTLDAFESASQFGGISGATAADARRQRLQRAGRQRRR